MDLYFIKIIISQITIDFSSTVTYIRSALSDMIRFYHKVTHFNNFVKAQLDALQAGEKQTSIRIKRNTKAHIGENDIQQMENERPGR